MVEVPNVEVNKWIEYQLCKRDSKHVVIESHYFFIHQRRILFSLYSTSHCFFFFICTCSFK